jgi:hypothetical protein
MDWLDSFTAPSSATAVLTAMITPAVLISACGTLVLSTSTRLARVLDRVRTLAEQEETAQRSAQIETLARRGRLLQFALALFYLGVAMFVSTSMAIGVVAAGSGRFAWVPVILALLGAVMLLGGSLILIVESKVALQSTLAELRLHRRR